jgi:hypothetical protein
MLSLFARDVFHTPCFSGVLERTKERTIRVLFITCFFTALV